MRTIEILPVEDDERYLSHVTLVVVGWLVVTLVVGALFALVVFVAL